MLTTNSLVTSHAQEAEEGLPAPEVVSGLRWRMGVEGCNCGKLAEATGSSRESGKNDIKPGKMQAGWRAGCEGGGRESSCLDGEREPREEAEQSFAAGLEKHERALRSCSLGFIEGLLCAKAESQALGRQCWLPGAHPGW